MTQTLEQWLAWAPALERLYQEELGRSAFSDPQAFVNWTHWWREHGWTPDQIRAEIRESKEWRARHPGNRPPPAPEPPPPVPTPQVGGGAPIQVTNESDGHFVHRMYSYWSNAWVTGSIAYVFAGHSDGRPRVFKIDLGSGAVERLGWRLHYGGTTEGWSWDAEGWIYLLDGPRLRHFNPFTGENRTVFNISDDPQLAGCDLWQSHSSDDGKTHSATVRRMTSEGAYPKIGTVVYRGGHQTFIPAHGELDESQVTPDGAFLIIKEDDDNRIVTLATGESRVLSQSAGAVGHSDCGDGFVVGEDDQHGACVYWDLRKPLTPENRRELFTSWAMGHVSIRGGRCLLSNQTHLSLVALDGSGVTPLLEHGSRESTGANLDPSGRVACYMSNGVVYLLPL